MTSGDTILTIAAMLIMLAGLFFLFGGMQVIAWMHATRQYRKLLAAWYQRTNPNDPMPIFNPETHETSMRGDGDGQ